MARSSWAATHRPRSREEAPDEARHAANTARLVYCKAIRRPRLRVSARRAVRTSCTNVENGEVRARAGAQQVQGLRRQRHLRARAAAHPVQGLRRQRHLRARAASLYTTARTAAAAACASTGGGAASAWTAAASASASTGAAAQVLQGLLRSLRQRPLPAQHLRRRDRCTRCKAAAALAAVAALEGETAAAAVESISSVQRSLVST